METGKEKTGGTLIASESGACQARKAFIPKPGANTYPEGEMRMKIIMDLAGEMYYVWSLMLQVTYLQIIHRVQP